MAERADFLVEIGTEELPPKALTRLAAAFRDGVFKGLTETGCADEESAATWYCSPRRLAVLVEGLLETQPEQEAYRRGPPLAAAYQDGKPTKAAEGFAASCGVKLSDLDTEEPVEGKGLYLVYRARVKGKPVAELVPEVVRKALAGLPIPRRMRWGAGQQEFVRPVHWVCMRIGRQVVETEIYGITSSGASHGHRFHHPGPIEIRKPAAYAELLEKKGKVRVDDAEGRLRRRIADMVRAEAEAAGAYLEHDADSPLVAEVAALVEWPVAFTGDFDEKFLDLPDEVIVSVLEQHQRYFPLRDESGALIPKFVATANIESRDMDRVRHGNERVVHPRLQDAMFFWETDRRIPLEHRVALLKDVLFQKTLGSLQDKSDRVAELTTEIARLLGAKPHLAKRAAHLAKADLTTEMVGEFPELQGVMGRYYALSDGEEPEVAAALEDQYRPRFSGDRLPESDSGAALAVADKLDTIVGLFAIGQPPTGDKDPFAVRRAAVGVLRIVLETMLDLDLADLIHRAAKLQPLDTLPEGLEEQVFDYMMDRLRSYYMERDFRGDVFEAVLAKRPTRLLDFEKRMQAVSSFMELEAGADLAGSLKRISNILRKSGEEASGEVDRKLLKDDEEITLNGLVERFEITVVPHFEEGDYSVGLEALADLKDPVDRFFDAVMVMDKDEAVRANRLALLVRTRELFLHTADLSRVQS